MKKILFRGLMIFLMGMGMHAFSSDGPLDEIPLDSPVRRKKTLLETLEERNLRSPKLSDFNTMLNKIKKPFRCCLPKKTQEDSDFHDL